MPQRIERNKEFICFICKAKGKQLKSLMQNATDDQIKTLNEIALNVINGNVPLSKQTFSKLGKGKKLLRIMADKKLSAKKKRKGIQKGGWILPLLASTVLPMIVDAIQKK